MHGKIKSKQHDSMSVAISNSVLGFFFGIPVLGLKPQVLDTRERDRERLIDDTKDINSCV